MVPCISFPVIIMSLQDFLLVPSHFLPNTLTFTSMKHAMLCCLWLALLQGVTQLRKCSWKNITSFSVLLRRLARLTGCIQSEIVQLQCLSPLPAAGLSPLCQNCHFLFIRINHQNQKYCISIQN